MPTKSVPPSTGPRFFLILLAVAVAVIAREVVPRVIDRFALRVREEHRNQYNLLNGIRQDVQTLQQIINTTNSRLAVAISNVNTRGVLSPIPFLNQQDLTDLDFYTEEINRFLSRLNNQYRAIDNMLQLLRDGNSLSLEEITNLINESQRLIEEIETRMINYSGPVENLITLFME